MADLRAAERDHRSAVHKAGHSLLPQSADLSERGSAEEAAADLPLRAEARRLLFLGPSETIGSFTDLFEPLDKRWKIFRRKEYAAAGRSDPGIPATTDRRTTKRRRSAATRP